jgi:hypothetical protein
LYSCRSGTIWPAIERIYADPRRAAKQRRSAFEQKDEICGTLALTLPASAANIDAGADGMYGPKEKPFVIYKIADGEKKIFSTE